MREVPEHITEAWLSEDKTGPRRPVVRATIARHELIKIPYDTADAPGGDFEHDRHRRGMFTTMVMGNHEGHIELRNIKEYSWNRSINADVAEMSMTIMNTDLTPIGNQEELAHAEDFDQPGLMSPSRGLNVLGELDENPWGYDTQTGWSNLIAPDRLIRTYEGYGSDPGVHPALDENLLPSGLWLIDVVEYTSDGNIAISCRDVGRLLHDQIVFPPVIPKSEYPLSWSRIREETVQARDATGGSWTPLRGSMGTASSSNNYYIGAGLGNPPLSTYVSPTGGVNGHKANHVLSSSAKDYWWSTGQTTSNSKVWWEFTFGANKALNAVRLQPKGGPYRVYISVKTDDGWVGRRKIPYNVTTADIDVEADIPFVYSTVADRGLSFDAILPKKYGGVRKLRITFTKLQDTEMGDYPFRAGLKKVSIYTAGSKDALGFGTGSVLKTVGNYRDYTDIVKWCCAWGGFFWPPHPTGLDFMRFGPTKIDFTYTGPDNVLPRGRVWGDFMNSGTAGQADLTVDLFDKQPLMSIITYVRDMLGFIFFIDETGAVVWRMPNMWKLGNYLSPAALEPTRERARTSEVITIDDENTLLSYKATLSSRNLRERIFVANTTGKIGTVIKAYRPRPWGSGFRRIAGWTDQNFETKRETKVMADMISARQMFDYHRGQATIAGNPAIQIDDQVQILERVTNETYYHYVESVSCRLSMETGEYTYDLETHWLGRDPEDAWVVKVEELEGPTQTYLNTLGE